MTRQRTKGEETKKRLVMAALDAFHAQGYRATGIAQLVEGSGFPRGSLYFHFPQGKEEVATAAIALATDGIGASIDAAFGASPDPAGAFRRVAEGLAAELEASGYLRGCPVTTVALEVGDDVPDLRAACAQSYADWTARIARHLAASGFPPARAERLATFALSAIEGALVLARTRRSRAPLDDVVAELEPIFSAGGRT